MIIRHVFSTNNSSIRNTNVPIEHRFNPYSDNGGTVLGIAGEDFAVLAGDTRQVEGYSIQSRYESKIHDVGDDILMTANGFAADGVALIDRFKQLLIWYKFDNNGKNWQLKVLLDIFNYYMVKDFSHIMLVL